MKRSSPCNAKSDMLVGSSKEKQLEALEKILPGSVNCAKWLALKRDESFAIKKG